MGTLPPDSCYFSYFNSDVSFLFYKNEDDDEDDYDR
jgi:hypothetical protein